MNRRGSHRAEPLKRIGISLLLCSLVAGCGARLSKAQIDALNQQSNGQGSGLAGQSNGSNQAGGTLSGSGNGSSSQVSSVASSAGQGAVGAGPGSQQAQTGSKVPGGSASGVAPSAATEGLSISSKVCQGAVSGPGVSSSEIDLGNVSTLTGPVPGLFQGAQHGIIAFATYLNSIGGICGRRVVVKSADDNFDSSQNATATQSLAGSVFAFVGSFSAFDDGGASVLQSNGIPDVGEALSSQRFNLANNFSPEPKPIGWNLAPYVYFKQKYPAAATHMAVLTENASAAVEQEGAQVAGLESIGYKFVYTENGVEPTQTNFAAEAQAMKSAGAQGVVFQGTAPFYADLAKAIQNVGIQPFPLGDYGSNAYDAAFIADAGDAANGALLTQADAMYQGEDAGSVPMVALFDKWYQATFHSAPDLFAAWAWMSGLLFVDGLNAGGSISRSALISGLGQVSSFDAGGLVAPDDPAKKIPPNCYLIIDVVKGKFVRDPVDPATGFDCANTPDYFYPKG